MLTAAERSFYEVLIGILEQRTPGRYVVLAKVRLADLIKVAPRTERRQSFQNSINAKHVDFVLCDRQTLAPVLVVELDDSSHGRSDRQERDAFVNGALAAARLPIVHVANQHAYAPNKVYDQVAAALAE